MMCPEWSFGFSDSTMVFIPAGEFTMGTPAGTDGLADEHPQRLVFLSSFYIDRYELSNAKYFALRLRDTSPNTRKRQCSINLMD